MSQAAAGGKTLGVSSSCSSSRASPAQDPHHPGPLLPTTPSPSPGEEGEQQDPSADARGRVSRRQRPTERGNDLRRDLENLSQDPPKSSKVGLLEAAQPPEEQGSVQGEEERLEDRWFQETRFLPAGDRNLANPASRADLAGHGHQDYVRPSLVVCRRTHDDGRSFLASALV